MFSSTEQKSVQETGSTLPSAAKTSKLIEAVQKNQREEVSQLLSLKDSSGKTVINVNEVDVPHGRSALHWAAFYGYEYFITLLLDAGANVCLEDRNGENPFFIAVSEGHANFIIALRAKRAPLNVYNKLGLTAAFVAAYKHHVKAIEALKTFEGANINTPTRSTGRTPIFAAVATGNPDMIAALKAVGADVEMRSKEEGETPLFLAAAKNSVVAINALVAACVKLDAQDAEGLTAMHIASTQESTDAITALRNAGANPNIQDKFGRTPIYYAAVYGKVNAILALTAISANTNVSVNVHIADKDNLTPVYAAALMEQVGAIKALKTAGVNLDAIEHDSDATMVFIAAKKNEAKAIKTLVNAGANPNIPRNKDNAPPILIAINNGHKEAIIALLDVGANASVKTSWGTPLEWAQKKAQSSNKPQCAEIVELLREHLQQYPQGFKPIALLTQFQQSSTASIAVSSSTPTTPSYSGNKRPSI